VDLANIEAIARRVAESSGLELVEVEMRGAGGKGRMLRVVIDRPVRQQSAVSGQRETPTSAKGGQIWGTESDVPSQAGVTHEDCANVSREVSTVLDVEDAVPGGSYTLEVSSPGLDRTLRPQDYPRFIGSRIKVMTREPVNGNRHFDGRLESVENGRLSLETVSGKKKPKPGHAPQGQKVEVELANIEKANLVPEI